jgi:hypothetical protein
MLYDNVLWKMTNEKTLMIRYFVSNFLGHEPSSTERKEFLFMHSLTETIIYHKGILLGNLKFYISDPY